MTVKEFAINMWPNWAAGLFMLWITFKSGHKNLLRIEKNNVIEWLKFLLIISIYRYAIFSLSKMFPTTENFIRDHVSGALQIPPIVTLTVFWEDACHGLLLTLMQLNFSQKKWFKFAYYPLYAWLALTFAAGHLYQGLFAGIIMLMYIPITMHLGKKFGFGTVMVCHTLYDLATVLLLRAMI